MCQCLLADIQSNSEWRWANNQDVIQDIKVKKDNLETHMQSDEILRAALAEEPSIAMLAKSGFDNRIKALCATTEAKLAPLRDIAKNMRKMQAARMQ